MYQNKKKQKMKKSLLGLAIAGAILFTGCKKEEEAPQDTSGTTFVPNITTVDGKLVETITVTDDGNGTGTVTWTKNKVYELSGLVFVNQGQTLTIEAGTIIKGQGGQGSNASALVVAKGGKIIAEGTASKPIIFTSTADASTTYTDGTAKYSKALGTTNGLWGGVIILGKAKLNSTPGTTAVEGIPTSEPRGIYGGSDDADNSGILRYVSIRHGGTDIGAGNEINGLTLGGVGTETEIDYVEVFANKDDGIEFFGGAAQVSHAVVSFCGDDSYDYDEGFRGAGQFWLTVQDSDSDRAGEHDGGTDPETAAPYSHPIIFNATYLGNGTSRAITFRDNAGGEYHNSIFYNFAKGIDVEQLASGEDSYARYLAGDLAITNNIFASVTASTLVATAGSGATLTTEDATLSAYFSNNGNTTTSTLPIASYSNTANGGLDPTSTNTDGGATEPTNVFFEDVNYAGAFGSTNWAKSWTALDTHGYF